MYKIPINIELEKLKDEAISQISYGLNFISLNFSMIGYIQFYGSFSCLIDNKKKEYESVYPVENDFQLLKLLEKKLDNYYIDDSREKLKLFFEDGSVIELIGNEMYESYSIVINGKEIIV